MKMKKGEKKVSDFYVLQYTHQTAGRVRQG